MTSIFITYPRRILESNYRGSNQRAFKLIQSWLSLLMNNSPQDKSGYISHFGKRKSRKVACFVCRRVLRISCSLVWTVERMFCSDLNQAFHSVRARHNAHTMWSSFLASLYLNITNHHWGRRTGLWRASTRGFFQ